MSDSRGSTPRVSTSSQRPMARSWPLPAPPSGRSPGSCAVHAIPNARVTHHQQKPRRRCRIPRALEIFVLQNFCSPRYPRHPDANNQLHRWFKGENKGSDRQQPTRRADGRETVAPRPASTPPSGGHMPDQSLSPTSPVLMHGSWSRWADVTLRVFSGLGRGGMEGVVRLF
ncbi:hypothetical protein F5144DRAFT_588384 [Chaetomium tenue]|uniref:Uncharacterized protein n=1 Tax=Chaetomium tenue TaxID=1854479 RepID=A0ACB7PN71_9PEZI|nr:hypothetical protein F5144DRAFT_588384 [Chaetomium globosum]